MPTNTPLMGLQKPADGEYNWGASLRNNADKLDQAVGTQHNLDGTHKAITATTISVTGDISVKGVSLATELANAAQAKAERIAAVAAADAANIDRLAAEAAWTAALASNPSLNPQIHMNPSTVTSDLTIPDGYNAYAAGSLDVAWGINVNVGNNASLTII